MVLHQDSQRVFFFMKSLRLFNLFILSSSMATFLSAASASFSDLQSAAQRRHTSLELPHYPLTPEAINTAAAESLKLAEIGLTELAKQDRASLTFASTFAAYDRISAAVLDAYQQLNTLAEAHPDKTMRDAARDAGVRLQEWSVSLDYRDDVYQVLKAYADGKPALDREERRLLDEQMRNYRRAGLALPPTERAEVEKLRKALTNLSTEFSVNINEARGPIDFTAEELAGVPADFLESPGVKQADGRFRVMANVTWHAVAVAENADNPETRRRLAVVRGQLAREKNVPVLKKLVALRADIAHRLGYATWADFQTEVRMAKTGAAVIKFEEDLVAGLQPKFAAEMATLRALKAEHTGNPGANLEPWDISYYTNKLRKERYAVDAEKLRVYFPYQATLAGMFAIYEKIFGLKFSEVEPPYTWAPGMQLFAVTDAGTGAPLGAFYLDMFPREGKFNHFACFPQKTGGVRVDGRYDLPIQALVCNFPAPSADKPSLLKHSDVETLFHEFGHVMHGILSRSRFVAQTGFAVPQDFIEAPSQMLENWVWNKTVLDTFAADYRDPAKKIPAETIMALEQARQATEGYSTRRQLSFGLIDMAFHARPATAAADVDVVAESNAVLARVTVAPTPDTAFVAYFGHLAGYDAGYYGYLWAKVLALDMASEFKKSPAGFLDEKIGRRLRDEIYAVGNTRDVGESVDKFLGRPRSQRPFLEHVGIKE